MNTELMLDTLATVMQRSQTQIQQILRKNKPLSSKMKDVSMNMAELKYQILEWIFKAMTQLKNNPLILTQLQQLKSTTFIQLSQLRLHSLLKSKLNKARKQSFMNSTVINDNHSQLFNSSSSNHNNDHLIDQNKLNALEQSVILLEKDLNIYQQQQEDFNVSAIIQRTKLALFNDDNVNNISGISQVIQFGVGKYESFGKGNDDNRLLLLGRSQQLLADGHDVQLGQKNGQSLKDRKQENINLSEHKRYSLTDLGAPFENKLLQSQLQSDQQQHLWIGQQPQQQGLLNRQNAQRKRSDQTAQTKGALKAMKKKGVQRALGNVRREHLLGSLLQETYNEECVQRQ